VLGAWPVPVQLLGVNRGLLCASDRSDPAAPIAPSFHSPAGVPAATWAHEQITTTGHESPPEAGIWAVSSGKGSLWQARSWSAEAGRGCCWGSVWEIGQRDREPCASSGPLDRDAQG